MEYITRTILSNYFNHFKGIKIHDNTIKNIIVEYNSIYIHDDYLNSVFLQENYNFYKFKYKLNVIYLIYLYYLQENNIIYDLNNIKKIFIDFEKDYYNKYYNLKETEETEEIDIKFINKDDFLSYDYFKTYYILYIKLLLKSNEIIYRKIYNKLSTTQTTDLNELFRIIKYYNKKIYMLINKEIKGIFSVLKSLPIDKKLLIYINKYLLDNYDLSYLDFFAKVIPFLYFIELFKSDKNIDNYYETKMYKFYDEFTSYKYRDNYIEEESIEEDIPNDYYDDDEFEAEEVDEEEGLNNGGKKKKKRVLKKYKK
jgi:hypothetical protein